MQPPHYLDDTRLWGFMFVKFCSIDTNVLKWSFISYNRRKINFLNIGKTKLRMPKKMVIHIRKRHNHTICALHISNNLVRTYDLVYSRSSTIFGLTSVFCFFEISFAKKKQAIVQRVICCRPYMLWIIDGFEWMIEIHCWESQ